ncbi:hypothetical protein M3223_17815 [Paenibacillus pasadenensis]|uniref:hypothetical protein n=1 Tax=Paenibacillus pasadenensis TaxID=217090 RepID=UPI00203E351E|nr:hypothetical protein [Paenibacillus pasadenensis]MCM3749218.1 hypothetical protein [Paenibacillus pasadenensis]
MKAEIEHPARYVRLTGDASIAGGSYERVTITGDSTIHGNTDCSRLEVTGSLNVYGRLTAVKSAVTGTVEAESLAGGVFRITGELTVREEVVLEELRMSGKAYARDSLRAGSIRLNGDMEAITCDAETVMIRGMARVSGQLRAEDMELKLYGDSRIGQLTAGSIRVSRPGAAWRLLGLFFRPSSSAMLEAGIIEGDVVELEHTRADIVRGGRVFIGEGCEIGTVEYSGELTVLSDAKVGERIKR